MVVDKGSRWGGQWEWQYDYVRLHQPHTQFTAGERTWAISGTKPASHLASKTEILSHFEDIAAACVREHKLDLVMLLGHAHDGTHTVVQGDSKAARVQLVARPLDPALGAVTIVADRLIKCRGFAIPRKEPFALSTRARVHALTAVDVLTPKWTSLTRHSLDKSALYTPAKALV